MKGHSGNTIVTMQLGVALVALLGLLFISAGLFYLFTFNYAIGPYFTATRAIHFYAGLASIPFLLAKYGSTGIRLAGYYLRIPRFKQQGPPALVPRMLSPLLAADFFLLYLSGLYMLFHYYYTIANIPPFGIKPVQLHLWAAVLAVPLIAAHLGAHLVETARGLFLERGSSHLDGEVDEPRIGSTATRRAFLGTILVGGLGLAYGFQNTPLVNKEVAGLFIGRIPESERGRPGDFPVETLFGRADVDVTPWRLRILGAGEQVREISYQQLLAMPATTARIRLSCVSGWSVVPTWSGPRVREVLALAEMPLGANALFFHSLSDYNFTWHISPLLGDEALLATHVNGAPLSLDHGFPLRLIVPGYPGQNMVKQIDEIEVLASVLPVRPDFSLT